MPWRSNSEPSQQERIIGGLSYLTCGVTGLLYMVFSKRREVSTQFRFHTFQSIFLAIVWTLIGFGSQPLITILANLVALISRDGGALVMTGAFYLDRIVSFAFLCMLLYGAIRAFLGKFAEIPFVSDVIHRNMPA
jgi:uncharacterized membrane protein